MEKKNPEFDDIRPYYDEEVTAVIERLLSDPEFRRVIMGYVFPDRDWDEFQTLMRSFKTKREFQHSLVKHTVLGLVSKSAASVTCSGLENIEKDQAYTFLSNHRDIVLDASLISSTLGINGYDTTEIAIGDNLLVQPWIEDLVRLNKSFIVKRGVSVRQILEVARHLSEYIHFAIEEKKESVWIAQREGRAKDSNDRTQESLLKMLAMGGDPDWFKSLQSLNITPISLSYEYDPCDYLKAKEFQQKRDNPEFKKSPHDDLLNMETGLFGDKGNIHFQFGEPINSSLQLLDNKLKKNELITAVASLIDTGIFRNYRFYPVNYIAYDRLWGGNLFLECYTAEDLQNFDRYMQQQLDKIDLPDKDLPFLTEMMWTMYAYPVKNHLEIAT
ncbi:MAG: 1-acyl-sn-glycerol-3-phosphate acyltransferase [Dysgonamonadaceae bacterium]|jgi:1-acyl-sn-glycerol-3-phosphate acyltransferase|nr:1-acyl-sn-glycerol-3-phosphate acyltransferase [Dysgonamonadaceae bacterium]